MAAVAELGLLLNQEMLLFHGVMGRVTVEASDRIAGVGRFGEVRLFVAFAVTGQTASAGFLAGLALEHVYFAFVAASGDVLRTRTVATFAALLGRPSRFIQRGFPVRRFLPAIVNFFVTGFAGFRAYVAGCGSGRWNCLVVMSIRCPAGGHVRYGKNHRRRHQRYYQVHLGFGSCHGLYALRQIAFRNACHRFVT